MANKTLLNHKVLKKKKEKKNSAFYIEENKIAFQFFWAYIDVHRQPPKRRRFGGCTLKINKKPRFIFFFS